MSLSTRSSSPYLLLSLLWCILGGTEPTLVMPYTSIFPICHLEISSTTYNFSNARMHSSGFLRVPNRVNPKYRQGYVMVKRLIFLGNLKAVIIILFVTSFLAFSKFCYQRFTFCCSQLGGKWNNCAYNCAELS